MRRNKVHCCPKSHVRSRRVLSFAPMTAWAARKLEAHDPVSVVTEAGQRAVGVVLQVYAGAGAFTRVRVAHGCTIEDFVNRGWKMGRLIAPVPPRRVMFFPETKDGTRFYARGIPTSGPQLDF